MKLIIDIKDDIYNLCKTLPQGYRDEVIAKGMPLDDETNGEIILKLFNNNDLYNLSIGRKNIYYSGYPDVEIKCGKEWWNSLYKENK